MFGGGEDFVEVNWNAETDEEKSSDAGADPIWRLEGRRSDELRPEGDRPLAQKDRLDFGGIRGLVGDAWVQLLDIGLAGCHNFFGSGEVGKVEERL